MSYSQRSLDPMARDHRPRDTHVLFPVHSHCSRRCAEDLRFAMTPLKAFLVEDSPVIRENLVAALEELLPLRVVGTAEDEAGAVSWLGNTANSCDIAIVDIFLRRGSGLGVLRALQQRSAKFDRVVLTNYATEDMRRQCLLLGASHVFDKSGEIDALVAHCLQLAGPDTPAHTEQPSAA